ncbi:MAG: hypothetical protein ACYC7E_05435 [Armatimonadota bacterium]
MSETNPTPRQFIWESSEAPTLMPGSDEFRAFAEKAAALGATHIGIGQIYPSRWQMIDPRDPHPEWTSWPIWSMPSPGIFKFVVPPELAEWLPAAEAERNLELVRERCEVLRALGLRAVIHGNDPMWLPEGVYRAHPEWRGAQAELLALARLSYFSPCVDHPEVLDLYRRAVTELCRQAPELDYYSMLTNDSAGALCWTNSYPGLNGPDECRHRSITERVKGFLSSLQQGARDAGSNLSVNINVCGTRDLPGRETLPPGQFYNGRDAQGTSFMAGIGGCHGWFGNHYYPVVGVPRMISFAEETERALNSSLPRMAVSVTPALQSLLLEAYKTLSAVKTDGPSSRMAALRVIAASRVGEEKAEALLEVWVLIEKAVECGRHCRERGFASLPMVGPAMMRWLTMPLVPDPSRLTAEETAYYQKHRVAKNATEADSYHAILGRRGIVGPSALWMATNSLNEAINFSKKAAAGCQALIDSAVNDDARRELTALHYRLRALAGVYTTCRNFIQYEDALATCGPNDDEVVWRDETGTYTINRSGVELRTIARSEMDNALTLAKLVDEAPEPLFPMAATPEEEDSFIFSPDLSAQLRKKATLMLDHWEEYNEFYPAPSVITARQTAPTDQRPGPADE